MIFAKSPEPGKVKTRLARTLGASEAADIYRRLAERVVERVRPGSYETVIYYDPPESEAEFRRWLGADGIRFLAQPAGRLDDRLNVAFDRGFAQWERVCVIGTDSPDIDHGHVERAFSALEEPEGADAVFGPALDGGYYLLALRRPAPMLFRDIPWSTAAVLETSIERARASGLRVHLLASLADVDHVEDLPEEFRSR